MILSSSPNRHADALTERALPAGTVIGSIERDGTHGWRGLPYAAPPIGRLRWRAPQPLSRWQQPRLALSHGHRAPQYAGPLAGVPSHLHGQIIGDEDCLTLNVFAPGWAPHEVPVDGDRRPVMVWIHGGGNSIGTSVTYDVARSFAREDGLIVVTVNYRLGVFGWFRHPALVAARAATEADQSGNFGTMDLIAALHWIRVNIAAFGGDPGCVTIFGESAGAQNVLTLLASPLAAGLFHRAIAQSPLTHGYTPEQAVDGADPAFESERVGSREIAARLASRCGAPARVTATWLRSLATHDILSVFNPGSGGYYGSPRPIRDGHVLPSAPLADVFRSGEWNRVPVIIGTNRDEIRPFIADKPEYSRLMFGSLPMLIDRSVYALESDTMSAVWRSLHLDGPADAMLAGGHRDVWTYRFDWDEAPPVPYVRPDLLFGAGHGMEIPFVFRDMEGRTDLFKVSSLMNLASRRALSGTMASAWASFARKGRPTVPDTTWAARRRTTSSAESLVFDSSSDGGVRMETLRRDVGRVKAWLKTTDAIRRDELRCQIYARTFLWSPLLNGHGSEEEYAAWCDEFGCDKPAEAFQPEREI